MKGRKPKQDSRGNEICAKLAEWKQKPESARPSLRALARELGTSHQLLSHYLEGLEKWQMKEYRRQEKQICARAEAQHRPLTFFEEQQAMDYGRAALRVMAMGAIEHAVKQLERDAKKGTFTTRQVKVLRDLASRGHERSRKIIENLSGAEKIKK
jgi:hypothetical protein